MTLKTAQWTDESKQLFVQQVKKEFQLGFGTKSGGLKKQGWSHVMQEINTNARVGLEFDKSQLQSLWSVMKKKYFTFQALRENEQFQWDPTQNLLIASQEVKSRT